MPSVPPVVVHSSEMRRDEIWIELWSSSRETQVVSTCLSGGSRTSLSGPIRMKMFTKFLSLLILRASRTLDSCIDVVFFVLIRFTDAGYDAPISKRNITRACASVITRDGKNNLTHARSQTNALKILSEL